MTHPVRHRRALISAASLAALVALWEISLRVGWLPGNLVPLPSQIPGVLWAEVRDGIWLDVVLSSLSHYSIGLGIGSVLGIGVGMAAALLPWFDAAHSWLARLLRPIPPLAWIPFAIIWFGVTEAAAAFIISIGVFWINYFTSYSAVRAIDDGYYEVAQAFGQGGFRARLAKISLPAAAPGILGGLRAGLGQGWMTVVAAELFGIPGIGQRMMEASGLLATDVVVVYMLTIAALYALFDFLFMRIQRRVLRWQQ
ncbi:NitT/TauT family transport system permease protein [Chromohalobacter marismortui]|uniref:NitT/TauT family transport system permease protein n=1 Tax=Chromohalobacter marismortui TaxID=42055 RepID=A0A4R7NMW1_9GAMM|nr:MULTISPECIES: ABC transporter permease [Chromohalobacter]MCI0509805.1 ABC transporter permease [Chromohalobacter sp.]MCI0592437.1 ABC transporter permease [Chromohalobacter sp.]TDU22027.1 NitT/TauT family transport system permease protein [Chromohalobacter marismortui]